MGPQVHIQAAGVGELLVARQADMRFLLRMGPHVHSQVAGVGERRVARLADMRLVGCVPERVPRMRPHAHFETAFLREMFVACLTHPWLLARMGEHVEI
jgi:hypothetical protein